MPGKMLYTLKKSQTPPKKRKRDVVVFLNLAQNKHCECMKEWVVSYISSETLGLVYCSYSYCSLWRGIFKTARAFLGEGILKKCEVSTSPAQLLIDRETNDNFLLQKGERIDLSYLPFAMPLESIWADAPDKEPVKKQKPNHKRNTDNKNINNKGSGEGKSNNRRKDTENKVNSNRRNGENKTKNKIKETPIKQKNRTRSQGKISPVTDPLAINPFSQKITEVSPPPISPSKNRPAKTKSKSDSPSKMKLLKKKIEEQREILQKTNHNKQQQQVLMDFLNDEGNSNWVDDDEEELILQRLKTSLKI